MNLKINQKKKICLSNPFKLIYNKNKKVQDFQKS